MKKVLKAVIKIVLFAAIILGLSNCKKNKCYNCKTYIIEGEHYVDSTYENVCGQNIDFYLDENNYSEINVLGTEIIHKTVCE